MTVTKQKYPQAGIDKRGSFADNVRMRRRSPERVGGRKEGREGAAETKSEQIERLTEAAENKYLRETPAEVFEWTGELSLTPQKGTMALGGFKSAEIGRPNNHRWVDELGEDILRFVPEDGKATYVEARIKCTVFRHPDSPVRVDALSGNVTTPSGDRVPATQEQLEEAAKIFTVTTANIWRHRGKSVIEEYASKFAREDESKQRKAVADLGDKIVNKLSTKDNRLHLSGVIETEPDGRVGEQERFRRMVGLGKLMEELTALEKGHKEAYAKVRAKLSGNYFKLVTSPSDIEITMYLDNMHREVKVSLLESGAVVKALVSLSKPAVVARAENILERARGFASGVLRRKRGGEEENK